jgi:hypothetical protein
MSETQENAITLTFENAATKKDWKIPAVSSELMRDYVGQAAKQLFTPVPNRVGIATKDGQIVQDWNDKSVSQVLETYKTNVFVIGSPDQLGMTHGVFVLKDGNDIWGFHITHDGFDIEEKFYEKVKNLTNTKEIFNIALHFFGDWDGKGYSDTPDMNFYHSEYNPEENYSDITDYTLYFDGTEFKKNF